MKLYGYDNDTQINLKIKEVMAFSEMGKPQAYWFYRSHTSKMILNPRVFEKMHEFITR